jgi:hypothetical protein
MAAAYDAAEGRTGAGALATETAEAPEVDVVGMATAAGTGK